MKRTRRRSLLGVLLAVPALAVPLALAGPTGAAEVSAPAELAATLESTLGARAAGAYQDARGALVVNVVDADAAAVVRRSGAQARVVRHSTARLRQATATLERTAAVAGTAWQVDPVTNQVVVSADSTVTGEHRSRLERAVAQLGGAARIETVAGRVAPEIGGGDAVYMGSRCSMAFAVLIGSTKHFLTAGHCTNIGAAFFSGGNNGTPIGTRTASSFPGNDYGLVRYTGAGPLVGDVNMYDGTRRDIATSRNAVVGETVGLSGSTSGLRRGRVTGVNVTVNYPQGPVHGLIQTTICSAGGDSGGAVFAGNAAIGIHSGSSGGCGGSNRAYHQPVTEALAAYGARVY